MNATDTNTTLILELLLSMLVTFPLMLILYGGIGSLLQRAFKRLEERKQLRLERFVRHAVGAVPNSLRHTRSPTGDPKVVWSHEGLEYELGFETVMSGYEGKAHLVARIRWSARVPTKTLVERVARARSLPKRARRYQAGESVLQLRYDDHVRKLEVLSEGLRWLGSVYNAARTTRLCDS